MPHNPASMRGGQPWRRRRMVSGLVETVAVSAGFMHTCALLDGGSVSCWGGGQYGQLGNAGLQSGSTPNAFTPVAVSGLTDAVAISSGSFHSCALLADHTVRCWGHNVEGQLGNGTATDTSTPVAVSGLTGAVGIAAGGGHTCALLDDGSVRCWGAGANYRADGTRTMSTSPVTVAGLKL